jgi:hypothetical protein
MDRTHRSARFLSSIENNLENSEPQEVKISEKIHFFEIPPIFPSRQENFPMPIPEYILGAAPMIKVGKLPP